MAKTTNSNYGGVWQYAGADSDAFDRTDVSGPASSLDLHNHDGAGKGLQIPYASVSAVAWTDIVPTAVTQGVAVTYTIGQCRRIAIGKLCLVWLGITLTSAGTLGDPITVTLPAGSRPYGTVGGAGTFEYVRASDSKIFDGICSIATSGLVSLKMPVQAGATETRLGAIDDFATADTDTLQLTLAFELA